MGVSLLSRVVRGANRALLTLGNATRRIDGDLASRPLVDRVFKSGAVAKWTKAADCKSAIPGSNPGGASPAPVPFQTAKERLTRVIPSTWGYPHFLLLTTLPRSLPMIWSTL